MESAHSNGQHVAPTVCAADHQQPGPQAVRDIVWRPFSSLTPAEVSFVLQRQRCKSPDEVFVTCRPGKTTFAVVSPDDDGVFHWAVFGSDGLGIDQGQELTAQEAMRVAREVQQVWSYRCEQRGSCRCGALGR